MSGLLQTEPGPTPLPWDALQEGRLEHRMFVLTADDGALVAIAVLSRPDAAPTHCPAAQLRALADDLYDGLTQGRSAHASVARGQHAD